MQRRNHRNAASGVLWFGLLLATAVACGQHPGQSSNFAKGLPAAPATPRAHGQEQQMFERLNRDRAAHGLPALKYDERLADIGRAHSTDMRDHAFFDHVSPTFGNLESRVDRAGYENLVARENLAEGPDVNSAEDSLLASPHHFENMMATDITHVGIGLVQGGVKDPRNLTITQVFAKPSKVESPAQVKSAAQATIRKARQDKNLPIASTNARLTAYAEEHLRGSLGDSEDPDVKAIGVAISKRLAKEPISGVKGVSVGGQVLIDSSQFQVPSALLREGPRQYGLSVGQARPPGKRPVMKILVVVGL
jgi:uncharacterized protein YkwD